MSDVDFQALVSGADLIYSRPVDHSYEGQPLGNGKMGSLVWTTPQAIHLQINRSDVFAVGKNHFGHQAWPMGPKEGSADYCGACAKIEIDFGQEVFKSESFFEQRLSLYHAEVTIKTEVVCVRCLISSVSDVLVMDINDQRREPLPLCVSLSMWREPRMKTNRHLARYDWVNQPQKVLVVQQFEEEEFYCASAVGAMTTRDDVRLEDAGDRIRSLIIPARKGSTMLKISSAASWSRGQDAGQAALDLFSKTTGKRYLSLWQDHIQWWSEFWSRSFVDTSSPDGISQLLQNLRCLHLYYLASTSRGRFPSKWNGMLFITDGDTRKWGSQFWLWTTEILYFPLFASDAIDLTEPYFDMYVSQLPACKRAAKQRWRVEGAFFPETVPFAGPVILPESAGHEFRDVYLWGRKKLSDLSDETRRLCWFDSSLRTVAEPANKDRRVEQFSQYSWVSHLVSSGAELAVQAWWRYRYSGDRKWLAGKGYPLMRETAEFYRTLAKRGKDGRYHIEGTNVHEMFWGVTDGIMDLAAIRGVVPLAIRAARILKVDQDLREKWQAFLDYLAPYPMGCDPEAKALSDGVLADDVWAAGHLGLVNGKKHIEDVWITPVFPFEDWTLETNNPIVGKIVKKIIGLAPRLNRTLRGQGAETADRTPIAVARAGLADRIPSVLFGYYYAYKPLINGMSAFEATGFDPTAQAQSVEHLGCITMAFQEALLQSLSPRPGESEIIRVFPVWPKTWDAAFRLLARGGFLVTSRIQNGNVEFVEIESRLGEVCRIHNPWPGACMIVGEETTLELTGDVLRFETHVGGKYRIIHQE